MICPSALDFSRKPKKRPIENIMTNEIYYKVLGQFIRFALRGLSVVFAYVGITVDDQTTFFEVSVGILTPILLNLIIEGWSFIVKRFELIQKETARIAPAFESSEKILLDAKDKTSLPLTI